MNPYKLYRKYKQFPKVDIAPIFYYNFWKQDPNIIWFSNFILSRGLLERHPDAEFAFFSTLGNIIFFTIDTKLHPFSKNRKRVFFTGENVHYEGFADYKFNMLNYKHIDLSLGFDTIENQRYMRFPLWILEMFPANADEKTIKDVCNALSQQKLQSERNRFCALVSGNRGDNDSGVIIRKQIVGQIDTVHNVDCAGKLLRNTEELQTVFNDNKAEFLKRYKFFICPENISVDGYVTEKVFHSIGSGCIPIYNGSLNNPEPDVLNHEAILFWEKDGDNSQLIKKVEELWDNPQLYKEFFEQPRLQPDAWKVVWQYFVDLENRIDKLF